jgi:hypothetical protein
VAFRPRPSAIARASAALLAVALTGAPRVLAMHAPVEGHHCECKSNPDHHLECAACRRAALSARASDRKVPECHRAAARKALGEQERNDGAPGGSCLERACGGSSQAALTASAVEPYVLPSTTPLAAADRGERRRSRAPPRARDSPSQSVGAFPRPVAPAALPRRASALRSTRRRGQGPRRRAPGGAPVHAGMAARGSPRRLDDSHHAVGAIGLRRPGAEKPPSPRRLTLLSTFFDPFEGVQK